MSALAAPRTTDVDERVTLTFASNMNGHSNWLELTYPVDAIPSDMLTALAEIGFVEEAGMLTLPPISRIRL